MWQKKTDEYAEKQRTIYFLRNILVPKQAEKWQFLTKKGVDYGKPKKVQQLQPMLLKLRSG